MIFVTSVILFAVYHPVPSQADGDSIFVGNVVRVASSSGGKIFDGQLFIHQLGSFKL